MHPISKVFVSSIFICNAVASTAQSLPKNPTPHQVLGYRLQEQKRWINNQLPSNSVLYKMSDHDYRLAGNKNTKQNRNVNLKYLPLPVYNTSFGEAASKGKQHNDAMATSFNYPNLQSQGYQNKPTQTNTSELLKGYGSKKKNLLQ